MPVIKRTKPATLTPAQRSAAAEEKANAAVRTFTTAADDLEAAAEELDAAALASNTISDYHRSVAARAETAATQSRSNAQKIRALLS